ncbi:MAG: serine protease, partial [Bacteroidales bacterium]
MKKLTLIFSVIAVSLHLTAQISEGGLPLSYKQGEIKSITEIATYRLPSMDTSALAGSDPSKQLPLRYAVLEEVDTDLKRSAKRTLLPDGGTLWQYRINSTEGKSLQVIFRKYLVPEGARLWLYDDKYEVIRGAYSGINMTTDLMFVTGDFPGDHVIIEYYEPTGIMFEGEIIIGWVGQAFIDVLGLKSGNTDALGFIAVNCEEGIPYQNQKHSVCKYSFNDGQYSYLCSGALINNTRNDGTPYFLTAYHCINSESKAATIVAYFNFEEASCTDISLYASQTLSGTSLRTTGGLSDYTLLEFNDVVPSSYQPFFAGWDAGENPPLFSSCIHHPNGRTKKISLDNDPAATNEEN